MSSAFNILQQSPHDLQPQQLGDLPSAHAVETWVPSRYNIRAVTEDDRLVLWNTLSGSMSVFQGAQVANVRELLRRSGIQARPEGMVKYLVDRGFLIKEGTNEQRRVRLAFGEQHYRTDTLELILLASEDCNFRCKYCYEKFAQGTMQPWVRTALKSLASRRINTLRRLSVSWFGGEPLYGLAAIEDLAPFFLNLARENSVEYDSGMTTNGYLLTPDVMDKLLAWEIRGYQITLDGVAEDHDHNRPTRDGKGTFDVIIENVRSLARRQDDFHVTLRVNFDRNNHGNLHQFIELLEREVRDDPRFKAHFHTVGKWGSENDGQLEVCGSKEAVEIRRNLEREAQQRGVSIGAGLRDVHGGSEVCYAARPFNFIVGASGKIMKCTIALDTKDYNVVGNIREDGELDLDRDKMALWTEPAFESDQKCQRCTALPLCHGIHCPMVRFEENRSPCTPLRLEMKRELIDTLNLTQNRAQRVKIG